MEKGDMKMSVSSEGERERKGKPKLSDVRA